MGPDAFAELVRRRLRLERGRNDKQAPLSVALLYPSPYRVAMSSLGFLQIYAAIQAEPGMACERAFLPDDAGSKLLTGPVRSYERLRVLSDFPIVAVSIAYELELAGLVQCLEGSGVTSLRAHREQGEPLVIAGGPLTFSNPVPLAAFADVIVMGEADALAVEVLRVARDHLPDRKAALAALADMEHVFVPAHHGGILPAIARCPDALLPASSPLQTPDTELSDMFLIEAERGCSRSCSYCVMRRGEGRGMRLVDERRLLQLIPEDAKRVGLVGAAVSDHPAITRIVKALVARGAEVGLSSLRPDRLSDELVATLKAAGYRTLTTAMDGVSERMRKLIDRRTRSEHLLTAAERARAHRISRLKLYLMLGAPDETDADVDEGIALLSELSRIVPVSLAVAPFCAKRNTPLAGQPFAGIDVVRRRCERLRKGLRGRVEIRAASARWAWVEHRLAQGGLPEAQAVYEAVSAGGGFAAYKRALMSRAKSS